MGKKSTKELTPDEFYRQLKKQKQRRRATITAGVLLAVFLLLVFFVLPRQLPWVMQKVLGVVNAVLVMLVVVFGVKEYGKKYRTFKLPILKKIDTGMVVGGALFALVLGWWLSPVAPIKVEMPGADEVAKLLSTELTLAVLVMPDTTLAVIEPPVPPSRAVIIAKQISKDADAFSLLVKAIAERRFIEAASLATSAQEAGVDAVKLAVARGQLEVFSGQYTAAGPLFDQAVQSGGDATVVCQQAVAYALAGEVNKAFDIASRLLDEARTGKTTDVNALGMSLNLKAALAVSSGRFIEALTLTEASQRSWEGIEDSPYKAASRNNQAVVYAMLPKKYAGAETQFDSAMAQWGDLYGFDSAHVAGSYNNLGVLAISQAKFTEADERLSQALYLARRNYSPNSPGVFPPLNALARLNTVLGRYQEAEKFCEEAQKSVNQAMLPEMANRVARGALLTCQGDYRSAAGSLGRTLADSKQIVAPEHVFLADVRSKKAAVNSLQGRFAETIAECQAAIETFEEQLGPNHPLIARTCNTLGWEYVRVGKKNDAKQQFERAQEIFAANKNEVGVLPDASRTLAGLAQLHPRRDWRDALNDLREAVKVEAQVFGPALGEPAGVPSVDTPATADYLFEQAMLYTQYGSSLDYENAAALFERVIAMREKLLPPTHPDIAATFESFATLLKKMDKKEQAAAMEKKAEQARELAAKNS